MYSYDKRILDLYRFLIESFLFSPQKNDSVSFNIYIVILMLYISAKKDRLLNQIIALYMLIEKNRNLSSLAG